MRYAVIASLWLHGCGGSEAKPPAGAPDAGAPVETGPTAAEIDTFNQARVDL